MTMEVTVWGERSLPTPMSSPQLRRLQRQLLLEASAEDLINEDAIDAYLDRSPWTMTHGGIRPASGGSRDDVVFVLMPVLVFVA